MKTLSFNANITPVSTFRGSTNNRLPVHGRMVRHGRWKQSLMIHLENTDKWVRGGLEQVNEMCYAFIYYYPRLEDISFCTSMTTFEVRPFSIDGKFGLRKTMEF